jgi:putative ABC transport system permease protein
MVLWRFTFREICNRPGRAALTLLSIVISVAAVVAVTISTMTTHEAYEEMYKRVTGMAALEVVADEEKAPSVYFDQKIMNKLAGIPGVQSAVPTIQRIYDLTFQGREIRFALNGVDLNSAGELDNYELADGTFFHNGQLDILMEKGFAEGLGIRLHDPAKSTVEIRVKSLRGEKREFRVVGLLAPKRVEFSQEGGLVFVPLEDAQLIVNEPGKINRVSIVLDQGADEDAVRQAIAARLPKELTVISPAARSPLAKNTLQNAEIGLQFAFALSLMLAVFMIFNTFLMNVGERRRQLAILRAIGTTRGQIVRMLLLESLVMGAAGTVIGSVVGIGGATLLTTAMTQIYSGSIPPLHITWLPFFVVAVLGPAISLIGVYIPAHIAGRITPIEGMRPIVTEGKKKISWAYISLSVGAFTITGGLLLGCIFGWLPPVFMIPIGTIFTGAFVLLVPMVLRRLSQAAAYMLYPFLRVEGQIAGRQILRRRARTTLTIGILYIAVSTAVSMGTMIIDNVADVRHWFDTTMMGDFFLRRISTDGGSLSVDTGRRMPESLGEEIRKIRGVKSVDSAVLTESAIYEKEVADWLRAHPGADSRELPTKTPPEAVNVVIIDLTNPEMLPLDMKKGERDQVLAGLAQGEAVISTVLSNRMHTDVGDFITLKTPEGVKLFRVAGVATSYMAGGKMLYLAGESARKLLGVQGVGTYMIRTDPDPRSRDFVAGQLQKLAQEQGLVLYSFADLRGKLDRLLNGVIGSLWGLMALGFIVGAFGMANTLTMNVLEQTRELALLRVVAMTRKQVRKTILAQASIIGFIGLLTGTFGGLIGSYTINLCSMPLFGYAIDFAVHPELLAVCFFTGMIVILFAAWIPAERAARLNLLIALQYE